MHAVMMAAIGLCLCLELGTRGAGQQSESADSGAARTRLPSCALATAVPDLHAMLRARPSMPAWACRSPVISARLASPSRRENDPRFTSTRCRIITVADVEELLTPATARFAHADHPDVEVIEGDATNAADVARAVAGADVVASFLGNPGKSRNFALIMAAAADNIMSAAADQPRPPRCLMISSVGVGGSSWLIKAMLTLIGGRAGFQNYEDAEARVRSESNVPFAIIRPYALTDKPTTGRYQVIEGRTAHFARSIPRVDVARFFLDCVEHTRWDGAAGVNVGGVR